MAAAESCQLQSFVDIPAAAAAKYTCIRSPQALSEVTSSLYGNKGRTDFCASRRTNQIPRGELKSEATATCVPENKQSRIKYEKDHQYDVSASPTHFQEGAVWAKAVLRDTSLSLQHALCCPTIRCASLEVPVQFLASSDEADSTTDGW